MSIPLDKTEKVGLTIAAAAASFIIVVLAILIYWKDS